MSDISKINVEGVDYDIKDAIAREQLNDVTLTAIQHNSNLNDFKTTGKFYVWGAEVASTVVNSPVTGGFLLEVYAVNGVVLQIITGTLSSSVYKRRFASQNWSNWSLIGLPIVDSSDEGKILKVVNGMWKEVSE